MTGLPKNWIVKVPRKELVDRLVAELGISRPAAAVLVNRGIADANSAREFLAPSADGMHNPFLLPDIEPAVARIRRAIDAGEKILVYGDRDVDGVTSISIMVRTLKSLGADVRWYIPSDEGYGVHTMIIDRYADEGVTLIVTVDCGISANLESEHARGRGIDMVITDHHEPPPEGIPKAVAVVDPKRNDAAYPFTELAGCSVSFKVCEAVMRSFGRYFNEELVALGAARDGESGATVIAGLVIRNGLVTSRLFVAAGAGGLRLKENGGEEAEIFPENATAKFRQFIGERRLLVAGESALESLKNILRITAANRSIDILTHARQCLMEPVRSLEELAGAMGYPVPDAGNAEVSAHAVAELFERIERRADLRMKFFQDTHLDAVALGTIADIMPLVGENRVLVRQGLIALSASRKPGVAMLLDRCQNRNKSSVLTAKTISWNVTPVLNAAGRRGRADLAAELLQTDSSSRAGDLIDEIMQLNSERKELQAVNMEKFLPLLSAQCDLENDKIFIVAAQGLEHGVTGIIASQIMRQYRRPTLLLIVEGAEAMGAARSVPGFDIVGALAKVSDLLVKYGGHAQAAGLTIAVDKLDEFRRRLREIGNSEISPELLVPSIEIDAEIEASDVTMDLVKELADLEPCGMGNLHPLFCLRRMKIREHSRVGANGDHLKLRVSKNGGASFAAIGWSLGNLEEDIEAYPLVDLAVQIEINSWQDKQTLQLLIQDIKPAQS